MWDAGEFIAAARTFGIPHPPGTPLYIMLARAWSLLLPFAGTAVATNLFSALCTALAGGALAMFVARATGSRAMALASALCAGGMFTVWSSATETEVYASVLLLAMLMLLAAERAGLYGNARWRIATAYALALAVPLHIGTLVAAPAAILLVAERGDRTFDWIAAARLMAVLLFVAGVGLANVPITAAGGCALVAVLLIASAGRAETAATTGCVLIALSALAVLIVRARFDPPIDSGSPTTLHALWEVVGRRQYGVSGMWPRQAPFWAQVANWFEYADWQVALGVSNRVEPSWSRTPITFAFALLGVIGSMEHRRMHVRSWRALALLFVSATIGLIVYLNFKAGASFGWGVLPETAVHEVRDRDYFYVLGFWVWGAWAGIGAVALARRAGANWIPIGVLAAAAPLVLNVPAASRRTEPERSIAKLVAQGLLSSAPPNAVLITGGDNDSFTVWYAQLVEGMRPDVTVVVAPLLGTEWYRAQVARRSSLIAPEKVAPNRPYSEVIASVAREARRRGRPVAVSLMTPVETRTAAGDRWVARGLVYVDRAQGSEREPTVVTLGGNAPVVDTAAAAALGRALPLPAPGADDVGIDPAPHTFVRYLRCPSQYLAIARGGMALTSLDSVCNLR